MKHSTIFLLIILAFLAGFGSKAIMAKRTSEPMHEKKKASRQLDEERIRNTEAAYDHAWHKGDIDGIMACFTSDALLISPREDVAHGTEQIRKLLIDFLSGEAKSTKHTSRISRVSFICDDAAVVDGEAIIEGADNLSDGIKRHRFTDILVRSGESWHISHIRACAGN